jgi:excisionase family DNA binding protein
MKKDEDPGNRFLTRAGVAQIFQVSPSTITRWAEAGKLPVIKTLGGHRRYEARAVMELARHLTPLLRGETGASFEEEIIMEKIVIDVPAMYGDHHVLEVRRILLGISGVERVNASSCFQTVEVSYDPTQTSAAEIATKLDEAGYLDPLPIPAETGTAVSQRVDRARDAFFRHTIAYEQAKQVVSFAQDIHYPGRSWWPCPGVGLIKGAVPREEASHA